MSFQWTFHRNTIHMIHFLKCPLGISIDIHMSLYHIIHMEHMNIYHSMIQCMNVYDIICFFSTWSHGDFMGFPPGCRKPWSIGSFSTVTHSEVDNLEPFKQMTSHVCWLNLFLLVDYAAKTDFSTIQQPIKISIDGPFHNTI